MRYFFIYTIIFIVFQSNSIAQNFKQRYNSIDIQHYKLSIAVTDANNRIDATMDVSLKFKQNVKSFELDLVSYDPSGTGMIVESILEDNDTVFFKHENNKITIPVDSLKRNQVYTFSIKYHGIPKDGLVIGQNKYGDRTFFGDNWPERARFWFPCVDHPSDKATVEYIVKAPNHYQVIANGSLIEETNIDNYLKEYHWKTNVPLPTKVMVIGISKFAVQNIGETYGVPVSTWVYPQNKEDGFFDFAIAKDVLNFFIEIVGDYPYQKLANVQSKTRFGGMENAGNIFYFEKAVTGERAHENLIAHEIAHQWFGNSASEIDWPHVWLSEGFATYFTDLYVLKTKGEEEFKEKMNQERTTVLNYYKRKQTPVIDKETTNYMSLLNANSYQKGAWVLHMLKRKIGDEKFMNGVRKYYQTYKFSNASTNNFKESMSGVSDKNLDVFFHQWLEIAGHPILKTNYLYYENKVRLIVEQTQDFAFKFPLDIEIVYPNDSTEIQTLNIEDKLDTYEIITKGEIKSLNFDPDTQLLFELIDE